MGALTRLEVAVGWTLVLGPIILVILCERSRRYRTGRLRAALTRAREHLARSREKAAETDVVGRWS